MDLLRSLPLGLYLERPIGWLHRLDPRVKLLWLMSFLLTPLVSNALWRVVLVSLLLTIALTSKIPLRVWRRQGGWLMLFCILLFFVGLIAPDGLTNTHQSRLPEQELAFDVAPLELEPEAPRKPWYNPLAPTPKVTPIAPELPELPQPTTYQYVLFQEGPLTITQRSLELAIHLSTLVFVLIFSTNLLLMTTAPEAITAAVEDLMQPLRRFNVPVTEITLTLTLSLRFLPLVLEEIQNLARSIQTRSINWKKLGFWGTVKTGLIVVDRLLENLLLRAEQISSAMAVRGFLSPDEHRVQWHESKLRRRDWLAIGLVICVWFARGFWGWKV